MKTSRPKFFRFATLGILLSLSSFALVGSWLWFTVENVGDNDACHVIALELADAWKRPPHGKVPVETVDAVAMYLAGASIIGVKRAPDGPRAGFGSRFHAVADERGVTCSTDGWLLGWGAKSVTVPWSERPGNVENPNDPWEPLVRKADRTGGALHTHSRRSHRATHRNNESKHNNVLVHELLPS